MNTTTFVADISEDDGVHREPISQPHRDCPVGTEAHEPHTFTAYNSGWRMVSCPGWTEEAEDDQPALDEDTDGFDIRPYALGSEDTDPVETITMRTIGQLSKTDPVVYIAELADPHQKRLIVSADQYNRLGKPETITVTITPTSY